MTKTVATANPDEIQTRERGLYCMETFMFVATVIGLIAAIITIVDKIIWLCQKIQDAHAEKLKCRRKTMDG